MTMIDFNLIPLLPEIFLAISAMGLLIVGVSRGNESTQTLCWSGVITLIIAAFLLTGVGFNDASILNSMFSFSDFSGFIKLMILGGLALVLSLAAGSLKDEGVERFEFPILILLAGLGMMLMVSASNLLSLYMALELQSLSLYVLAAFRRTSVKSSEAGVKYFTLGALSSGMILFGISLIYGFTGSIDFNVIHSTLATLDPAPIGVTFGFVFLLAGLSFKISAVPFHMWTPDVYQGAPTIVTALFAIVPKVAAFGILIRLLFEPFSLINDQWIQIIYALSLGSMILGAFAALVQEDIKRLLAYSSIGNMGYVLIGLVAGTEQGLGAVVLYLFIYMIMTAGTFAVVLSLRRGGRALQKISDLGGLSQNAPTMAYALAILMFSMSGIPPMAGFFGKLFIFQAAIEGEYYILATLGIISSVVAAYYYLRIVKVMFFDEPEEPIDAGLPLSRKIILLFSILFVLGFVAKPSALVEITRTAVFPLFSHASLPH